MTYWKFLSTLFIVLSFFQRCSPSFPIEDFSVFDSISLDQNNQALNLYKQSAHWYLQQLTDTNLIDKKELAVHTATLNTLFITLQEAVLLQKKDSMYCKDPISLRFMQKEHIVINYWIGKIPNTELAFSDYSCFSYQLDGQTIQHYWAQNALSLKSFDQLISLDENIWVKTNLLHLNTDEINHISIEYPQDSQSLYIQALPDEALPVFKVSDVQGQKIAVAVEDIKAYLSFYQNIQFSKLIPKSFAQEYTLDSTHFYAKWSIQTTDKTEYHFEFYPLLKTNGLKDPYLCWGSFRTSNSSQAQHYLFNYFHLDLFLKTASFFKYQLSVHHTLKQ
jgi:hypothetical protein